MKKLKNVLLFIPKSAIIAALILGSAVGWGFLLFSQTPGGLFNKQPLPLYLKLIDLLIILPLNIAVIVITAVFLAWLGTSKTEKTSPWKKIAHPAAIIAAAVVICVPVFLIDSIEEKYEEISVKADVAQADEIISYENSGNLYGDALFDSEIYRASMLLNYDEMTITFLYRMSYDCVKQVQLIENGFIPNEDHILQFKNPLRDGDEVRVYYDRNGDKSSLRPSFKTCAVTVEHSGKFYGVHFDPEPMEFESCLDDIYALEEKGLETVIYRKNELLPYAGNVKSDTMFLDPENKKLYLVYLDTPGFGVPNICLDEFDLAETDKIENVFIQAEFELESGNKLYAFGNEDYTRYANDPILKWQLQKTNGLALKYKNKLYVTTFNTNRQYYDFLHSTGAVKPPYICTTIEMI